MAYIKSSVAGIVAVSTAAGLWYFYERIITAVSPAVFDISAAAILFTVHLVALSVLLLFAEYTWMLFIVAGASFLPLMVFFTNVPVLAVTGVLFAAAVLHGRSRVQTELQNRLHFTVSILLRQGLPIILTGFSLVFAVGYFLHTSENAAAVNIHDIVPSSLIQQIARRTVPVGESSPDAGVFYELIAAETDRLFEPYRRFIPLAFAIALFLFLRTIALPYGWLVIMCSAGAVYVCRQAGIINRVEEQAIKERFTWG